MGSISNEQKTFPQDDPFDPARAKRIDLGLSFPAWEQGDMVWWRMDPGSEGFKTAGQKDTYYGSFPKTFRLRTEASAAEPDGALNIGSLSEEARERFQEMPSTDRNYARDYEGDKAANHIFYPRLWRAKGVNIGAEGDDDQFLLFVPKRFAESAIPVVDAMGRYIYRNLPTPLLWPYLRMSVRVLSTEIPAGKNSNPVFGNWHSHTSSGPMYKGIITLANGLTTRVAQSVTKIARKEFNEAAVPPGAVAELGAQQAKIVEGLRVTPPWTLAHFGDELQHDGSINEGDVFERRFIRNFFAVDGLRQALKDHPEIRDILEEEKNGHKVLILGGPVRL